MSFNNPAIHGLTLISRKDLEFTQKEYLLRYTTPIASVDSTTEVTLVLTGEVWKQGAFSKMVLHNPIGTANITMEETNLDKLGLTEENGELVLLQLLRSGEGTSPIYIGTTEILAQSTQYALFTVQRRNNAYHIHVVYNA